MLPDYTDHLNSRKEAAARTRQSFENKMQPTIHVQLQVRKIVAGTYHNAADIAYDQLSDSIEMVRMMEGMGVYGRYTFRGLSRVAKEVDGTYTVTLP